MAKFRKTAVVPGVHHTPEGRMPVSRERIRSWVRKFRAMKDDGIKVPIPWGHISDALPTADDKQFAWNRFNAGYLDGMEVGPKGELITLLDVPGAEDDGKGNITSLATLPDGSQVKTAIGEVSIGVRDWTDGKDRDWPDSIVHVALTTLPVWHGQDGFSAAADAPPNPGEHRFSLSTHLFSTEPKMAEEEGDKKPPDKPSKAKEEGDGGLLPKILESLAKCNIILPDDTDDGNFMDRLHVALVAYEGATNSGEGEGNPIEPGSAEPMAAETSGSFMSLLRDKNPMVRKLAEEKLEGEQKKRTQRIQSLVKRGLSPHTAKTLQGEATAAQLSLKRGGPHKTERLDWGLSLLEKQLPADGFGPDDMGKHVHVEKNPSGREDVSKLTKEMIARGNGVYVEKPEPESEE